MTMNNLRSSVRPVVTVALVVALIAATFTRILPPEHLATMAAGVVSYWFAARTGQNA